MKVRIASQIDRTKILKVNRASERVTDRITCVNKNGEQIIRGHRKRLYAIGGEA